MSSLTSKPNMTLSEILSLNLKDSALDLLNAAIASHQVKLEEDDQQNKVSTEDEEGVLSSASTTHANSKRELDKDEQTVTGPKRAGRKPLDKSQAADAPLDPKQKRKAQNRAAQRAFRDRKEKHVAELQARIDELEELNATKDEDLVKENEKLKEMLKKLQEENYALKGAQFTFEFAVSNNNSNKQQQQQQQETTNITTTNDFNQLYQTSGSSMSSNNSYSGDSSAEQQSPLSNSHTHEDDSASAGTPNTATSLFSTEPMQFGLISPTPAQQQSDDLHSIDFLAISHNSNNFGLGNLLSTSQNFPTSTSTTYPTVDLFHGKDDLFTNYRVPHPTTATTTTTNNNTNDDFLFANEDLSSLFGGNNELFGFNNNQFSFNAQFGLPETPATIKEKKQFMLEQLRKGQQEGKYIYQVRQEIQDACPDFNLDLLCDELKKKATCSMSQFPLTDRDVDAFVKCLDRA